jgi:predicted RNA-binding Zn-ribbon protein involved in translation (DUF1610 family)
MVDTSTPEWLAEANADLKRKGCPRCEGGNAAITREVAAKSLGTFSLAGMQPKVSGSFVLVLDCPDCGLRGRLDPQ